jgi:SAM-dependent MidA family methyltransferase
MKAAAESRRVDAPVESRSADSPQASSIADARSGNPQLVAALRDEIERDGAITFERFMELALYHPQHGYYVARSDRPTRTGDYLTAPETHPLFGHALARQLDEMWQGLGRPRDFALREYGAGTGSLAVSILDGLRAEGSGLIGSIRYQPVESDLARTDAVRTRVREAGFGEALSVNDHARTGCFLANELLDALPVHRVRQVDGVLREIFVTWRDGWFADDARDPSTDALAAYLGAAGVTLADGQDAELNLRAPAWIRSAASELERGYLLLIDYGHPAAELYGPRRFRGTLLGYRGHEVSEDPYAAVGEQDLTSHVDLSAVESAATRAALRVVGRTTQAEFLTALGLGELLDRLGRTAGTDPAGYIAARAATLRFLDPRAMGAFAVLAFGRDVPDEPLTGFAFRLRPG